MKVVSFIEPPQADVIEEILKYCGLWQARAARGPGTPPLRVVSHRPRYQLEHRPQATRPTVAAGRP